MTTTEPITATSADKVGEVWGNAFNRGDMEGMIAQYADDAVLVLDPAQPIHGTTGIREALQGFLALKGTVTFEAPEVAEYGDIALVHARWRMTGSGPEGPVEMGGYTSEVVRRGPDGTWKYVIDDPGMGR